jgi:hypothetical protein
MTVGTWPGGAVYSCTGTGFPGVALLEGGPEGLCCGATAGAELWGMSTGLGLAAWEVGVGLDSPDGALAGTINTLEWNLLVPMYTDIYFQVFTNKLPIYFQVLTNKLPVYFQVFTNKLHVLKNTDLVSR